jgi:hypothetical protein
MVITGNFGMSGEVQNSTYTIRGGVWVDGVQKFISGAKKRADASDAFRIKLDPSDRYLTFANFFELMPRFAIICAFNFSIDPLSAGRKHLR